MRSDYVAFTLLGLILGTNFLFMKEAVHTVAPVQVVWLRVLFGAIPILIFGFYKKCLKISHFRNAHHFFVMSILSTVIPYLCFVKGTQYLKSGAAGAISGIIPLLTAFIAAALLPNEKLNLKGFLGLLLGFVGVALVAHLSSIFIYSSDVAYYGTLFMFLGSIGYAFGMIYAKKFISPLGLASVSLACYQVMFAIIILIIIVPIKGISIILQDYSALLGLALGLGFLGSGVAFIVYYHIIDRLGAVAASSVFYIPPVDALVIGAVIGKESISNSQYLGAAIILVGVYLARSGGLNIKTTVNIAKKLEPI